MQGPSGCGKNSLIDCIGEQNNFEIVRFKDEKTKLVSDVYGDPNAINSQEEDEGAPKWQYPDDLEQLLYFIRQNFKFSNQRTDQPTNKTSAFSKPNTSSFSSKQSSFAQKKAGQN